MPSLNFEFLSAFEPKLAALGSLSERYFRDDPATSIFKVRQFGETLAKLIAARHAQYRGESETFEQTIKRLSYDRVIPNEAADIFHALRRLGNAAVHENKGGYSEALSALKFARQLGLYYYRVYARDLGFDPGPFTPPPEPVDASVALKAEIEALKAELSAGLTAAAQAEQRARDEALARESVEERLRREAEERLEWQRLAQETEAEKKALIARLQEQQVAAEQAPRSQFMEFAERGEYAAARIDLDEAATRELIDEQLRARGWEADTKELRYSKGIRPIKGRNLAIAEWPTASGPADYALFAGLTLIGVVEAKRKRRNVSDAIDQAQRYSSGIKTDADVIFAGGPWGEFKVPFVFATNGRAYLRQIETQSGIWFRDARNTTNLRRALPDWPTPEGLTGLLGIDEQAANAELAATPFDFGFPLRPYQTAAILEVEKSLAAGERRMLVAMATGTGKTKLAIAMLYRLLTAKRFRRICFVVDRSSLGHQTEDEFTTTKVVSGKTFAEIYGLKALSDVVPDTETKVHICTIQGLVKRVLYADDPASSPSVDQYDLMVIDECHRGYTLDREMSDEELGFRSQDDYISKYRRVLDYFDAVKIGLTATPALHTTEIFGDPIFRYTYREAVVDGFLIDHEPPIRIETALTRGGITFEQGEQLELIDTRTGELDLIHAPDEIHFDVEKFNKQVITEPFNKVVAQALAESIDPALPGKTLIFAVSRGHADMIVDLLKKAFAEAYGDIDDSAVKRITGDTDNVKQAIRSFRNDTNPKVAVTVDLLTTGIDVPSLVNLVFLRRVNSRILYEQMVGRATRKCDDIGKDVFRIFDAVDLYPHIQAMTEMRPVVVSPSITFEQLIREYGEVKTDLERDTIREQMIVKLRRRLKKLPEAIRARFEAEAGEAPEALLQRLQNGSLPDLADWLKANAPIGPILDWRSDSDNPIFIPISQHPDELVGMWRGYGEAQRPEDFLDSFSAFIRDNINSIAALKMVVQRPRDLTRADLKALRLALDRGGFSEANLKTAWSQAKDQDVAASIIGFVRQAALGDPLIPYPERVAIAMRKIGASRQWTEPQRRWLKRISEQVAKEIVVDREALDREPFVNDGGFNRLNKIFGGELENLLSDINEELWTAIA